MVVARETVGGVLSPVNFRRGADMMKNRVASQFDIVTIAIVAAVCLLTVGPRPSESLAITLLATTLMMFGTFNHLMILSNGAVATIVAVPSAGIEERKLAEGDILKLNEELDLAARESASIPGEDVAEIEHGNSFFVGREPQIVGLRERIRGLDIKSGGKGDYGTRR
jgi:hypothetical protein